MSSPVTILLKVCSYEKYRWQHELAEGLGRRDRQAAGNKSSLGGKRRLG
jgi:hypothetical protein